MRITQPMLFRPLCFGHSILAPLSAYSETKDESISFLPSLQ